MATTILGRVKAGKSYKTYEVKWDPSSKEAYVAWAGWTKVGKASSARDAMNMAEAFLYDK